MMKVLLLPLAILLAPVILYYFLCFKTSAKLVFDFFAGVIIVFLSWKYLIGWAIMISADGTFEKGIKCATGSIFLFPVGYFTTFFLIPLVFIKKLNSKNIDLKNPS